MSLRIYRRQLAARAMVVIFIAMASIAFAANNTNRWISTGDGFWRTGSNWSSNQPPSLLNTNIVITNATTKIVTIDAGTDSTNLTINKLTISAPVGSTNTLQLIDLTTNRPLQTFSTVNVERRGVLSITNSALKINGASGGILDVVAGAVVLDSGLIDCTTTTATKVGRTNTAASTINVNNGNMLVFQMQLGALNGAQGSLTLSNGLFSSSSLISLGEALNSTGLVTVVGGQLIVTNDITKVGNLGTGQLTVSSGSATFAFLSMGENFGSRGTVSVSGGQVVVKPRANAANDWLRVGSIGTGQLNLSGGSVFALSEVHLADDLTSTGMVSITGGQLIATNDLTAIGRYGVGQMTVSNSTVVLTNVSVGRHDGSVGTLIVQPGGNLITLDALSIGRFSNSVGHVQIAGGQLLITNDVIWIGREGIGDMSVSGGVVKAKSIFVGMSPDGTNTPSGSLVLTGGTTLLSSNLYVGTPSLSSGQVSVTGGDLIISNESASAFINISSGNFSFDGGTVTADNFFLTNSAGQFLFNSGTLQTKNCTVANGYSFVIGDGVNPATFRLLGGNYSFADGLVISSNATVTGCGTITGNITNFGTLATNCGPVLNINITAITRSNTDITVSFTTILGSNHLLEYKTNLNSTNWTAILPGVTGNGSVMSKTDTNASAFARYYRIHIP